MDWGLGELPREESLEEGISLERGLCFDGGVLDNGSQEREGLEKVGEISWVGATVGELAGPRSMLPLSNVKAGPVSPHKHLCLNGCNPNLVRGPACSPHRMRPCAKG